MRTWIRKALLTPPTLLLEYIRFSMVWLTAMSSPRRLIGGLTVVHFGARAEAGDLFDRLARSMDLLKEYGRIRLNRYLKRVIIVQSKSTEYWPFANACALSESTLRNQSIEWIASALMHEAVHARLWRSGYRYGERERSRIEEICTRAQIRFLHSLPGTSHLVDHLLKHLSEGWYSNEDLDRHRIETLKSLNAPAWIIEGVARLSRSRGPSGRDQKFP